MLTILSFSAGGGGGFTFAWAWFRAAEAEPGIINTRDEVVIIYKHVEKEDRRSATTSLVIAILDRGELILSFY